jgi:hypothetical protein
MNIYNYNGNIQTIQHLIPKKWNPYIIDCTYVVTDLPPKRTVFGKRTVIIFNESESGILEHLPYFSGGGYPIIILSISPLSLFKEYSMTCENLDQAILGYLQETLN